MTKQDQVAASGDIEVEVIERVQESKNVVSFYLKPTRGSEWKPFRAGQHLPLRLGLPKRAIATYTISSSPRQSGAYRLSVKLEPTGLGGSRFLHEQAKVGSKLKVAAPRGSFALDNEARAVLLLTGGIGITPALSMLHELAEQPDRPVFFVHACRDREEHAFVEEVRSLSADRPWIKTFIAYAEGTSDDVAAGHCDHVGLLSRYALRGLLPLDHYRTYLCGPIGFVAAMRATLISLGMDDRDILEESFGGVTVETHPAKVAVAAPADNDAPIVSFAKAGTSAPWDESSENLLDFTEKQGFTPDFSCRAGVCGTCAYRLLSGEVDYVEAPVDMPEDGHLLLCCTKPRGAITIDI